MPFARNLFAQLQNLMQSKTDKQLFELVAESEVIAFEELYNRYWKLLFHLAWGKVGDKEDSSDIVQELYTELWDKREHLSNVINVKSYLISILYNKIFLYFRRKGFREKHIKNFEQYLEQAGIDGVEIPGALESLERQYGKMQEIIEISISLMPERMRRVLLMKLRGDKTIDEIATQLNISSGTVKSHLQVAMRHLRKVSQEHALDLSLILLYISWKELIFT